MSEFYKRSAEETIAELGVDPAVGLSEEEVRSRQAEYGLNELPKESGEPWWKLLFAQFTELMVLVLIGAAVISAVIGDMKDVFIILAIVVLNAALGFYQEYRAEQALAALSAMQVPVVRTRRGGHVTNVTATELVPGDIVLVEAGDSIPADGRLLEAVNLQVEESAMTGESMAVEKDTDPIDHEVGLGERHNVVFMGTAAAYGRGEFVVTGTGLKTELGNIATLLQGVAESQTPLQERLDNLGKILAAAAGVLVLLVFLAGVLRGNPVEEMLLTSISLAVAAIPEGLPAVITIGLSLGASRMVKRNALIRRLPAVETLGSVTTICSDKTGTLTRNEMTTTMIALPGHDDVRVTGVGYQPVGEFKIGDQRLHAVNDNALARFLKAAALCTDAYLEQEDSDKPWTVVGDTTEGALMVAARKAGWSREQLEDDLPRVAELPFSSERKAMTTIHAPKGRFATALFENASHVAFTKGAPDRLVDWAAYETMPDGPVELSDERRQAWLDKIDEMAAQGLRVLGVAYRPLDKIPGDGDLEPENAERNLYLLGLAGIVDPPRSEARKAVKTARAAGIRPIMITGDHKLTAEAIAQQLGIIDEGQHAITGVELSTMSAEQLRQTVLETSAYARVSPEHKLRIVEALQSHDQIVAMTGDGVNDAPALKQADIGVAMGITGTDVSKGAADMVLTDDNFASIVAAVEEGRTIYDNIRKFIRYLLSTNAGEIVTMFTALMIGLKSPLIAIQILWINLVTDGLPAIALGFEPSEEGVMDRPPRSPKESIFADGVGLHVIWVGIFLGIITLAGYVWSQLSLGLTPFSATLGLEHYTANQLGEIVGALNVPELWDGMTVAERVAMLLEGSAGGGHGAAGSDLVSLALAVPRTIAFTILALSQIFEVSAIRSGEASFFQKWYRDNRLLFIAVIATFVLQMLVIYEPFLQAAFDTAALSGQQLAVSLGLASTVLFAVEIEKAIRRRRHRKHSEA
ncbi:MAG: cation-translocating P-type ATPase [Anaerolineae bacterium]|nr:cation-translocating P-type ATPase [Anaerolineae bacterium]